MRMHRMLSVAVVVLAVGTALAADLKSGPQPNQQVPGPFHPLNINGSNAGEKFCLYCANGTNPVAMVFARSNSPELTKLIKEIDAATAKNQSAKMGSFVVFLSKDTEGTEKELKELVKSQNIQKTILAIDNPAGPKDYNVSKNADITVVLYTDHTVKANYAFEKGKLTEKDITTILKDLPKILKN